MNNKIASMTYKRLLTQVFPHPLLKFAKERHLANFSSFNFANTLKGIIVFGLFVSFFSCTMIGANPQKIFNKIGLNGNKIPRSFQQHFKEIRAQKAAGSLTIVTKENKVKKGITATEYIENNYIHMFEPDIQGIKELTSDKESQPIIDAGLEMFSYADVIYKTDFPRIAKMIDDGLDDQQIDEAIGDLDKTKGIDLNRKYEKAMKLLLPYADKHAVQYEVKHMPF